MFDLQIDKNKKQKTKKMSSMNKSCEKKPTAHSQNSLYVDVLYNNQNFLLFFNILFENKY
jgi:hypothetical protein